MGDRSRLFYTIFVFNHTTYRPTQPGHPGPAWVGEMSTSDGYGYREGRKQRVLC